MPIDRQLIASGRNKFAKGAVDGKDGSKVSFVSWDMIKDCDAETCAMAALCPYAKTGICKVEQQYIRAVFSPLNELIEASPNAFVFNQVGLQLIPLYHHLIKLKMIELSIGRDGMVYKDPKGQLKVHPIYKEIRDTMNAINRQWREGGLLHIAQKAGYLSGADGGTTPELQDIMENGYPDFYEKMSTE
ncbi:MAG: hypothetical protein RBT11_19610 [Desulfobacterales bacterium]|jgi:hypothetical protein|nr:hypothetical protein [Desulfobacterales bacterium]